MSAGSSTARSTVARLLRNLDGAAAAEMALVFPIFGFVSLNVMDLCVYMYSRMQTEQAAQAAVGVARAVCNSSAKLPATSPSGHCSATLQAQMQAAAQATSLGTRVTIGTPAEAYYCADDADVLSKVADVGDTPPPDCSTIVPGSTVKPGDYIRVTASFTYVPFAPYITMASILPANVQQEAWIRLQ